MATSLSTGLAAPQVNSKKPGFLAKPVRLIPVKRSSSSRVSGSPKSPPRPAPEDNVSKSYEPKKNSSLSEQLGPLSSVTLPTERDRQSRLLSKPKSTWVNPTKPKRSVLSLQRQRKTTTSYNNPKLREIELYSKKINECRPDESKLLSVFGQIPNPFSRDDALLILKGLKSWEKAYHFLKWIKKQNMFPMETIFYNVTMKSLGFGKQFGLVEELANDMITAGVDLDNITYSTIITCAKRCEYYDTAVEWFERMYKTGLVPDEITYSAVLDVYAKLVKVEEALSLYERGVASGWKPDPVAFSVLARMFGEAGDYDGIRFVLQEMKTLQVQPNAAVYYTMIEAMGKAGKPGAAKSLFEEMIDAGLNPDERTLTALLKIYGRFRWAKDAMALWQRVKLNNWKVDLFLYNTMVSMCADLGILAEAEELFIDMKKSTSYRPDSWTYTAMLNVYSSVGDADKAMTLFEEMSKLDINLNVMGCTCLIQCLGRARRADDLVRVYEFSIQRGIKPDDRLCGCLLSVLPLCEHEEDAQKVLTCLNKANTTLVAFIKMIEDESSSFENVKEEFRKIVSNANAEARRPFCNCLIDICRLKNFNSRAHELLYLGTVYGLYPDLHHKTRQEWCLDVRTLSVGAALTALEEWMVTLAKFVQRNEELPPVFSALTGSGTHKFSHGLANSFAAHLEKLGAPYRLSDERTGCFVATREHLVAWIQSQRSSLSLAA